jgi:hypothetical protein
MKSELSWKSVLIIGLLLASAITMRVLGDITIASTLIGGVLGYVAQGFGYRRETGGATPESILPEQSSKTFPRPPALPVFMVILVTWLACFVR